MNTNGKGAMCSFVVEDEKYNYISARFPGDADLLAQKLVTLAQQQHQQ